MRGGVRQQQIGFLAGQIDDDQAIDAGGGGIRAEAGDAVGQQRVEVAHEDDRGVRVRGAEFGDHAERAGQRRAGEQAAAAGGLDGGAIGHRVGERHADLNEVGAGRWHAVEDLHAGGAIGIKRLQKRNQRPAPRRP